MGKWCLPCLPECIAGTFVCWRTQFSFLQLTESWHGLAWLGRGHLYSVTNLRLARAPSHHQMPAPGGGGPGHGTLSDARPWPRYLDLALTGRRSRRLRYSQSRSQVHSGERLDTGDTENTAQERGSEVLSNKWWVRQRALYPWASDVTRPIITLSNHHLWPRKKIQRKKK